MKPFLLLALALSLLVSACAEQGAATVEHQLPPLPRPTTTTTIAPFVELDERAADLSAQSDLEAGLSAAREIYGARGTFDASPAELKDLYPGQVFVALQEVASLDGVVYDSHGQRITLYRQSESGTWFCIDEDSTDETDYGLGASFEMALADCTDGVTAVGWKNVFTADGLDESAVENLLIRFARFLDDGDVSGAHGTFHPGRACPVEDLMVAWPEGRGLDSEARLELLDIKIDGDAAIATIHLGDATGLMWELERYGDIWYHAAEACDVLLPLAVAGQDAQARDLLLAGLEAVRTGFVERSAFDFSPSVLSEIEPMIAFGSLVDTDWYLAGYRGREAYGLIATAGAPGHFFCAVESLGAVTGYGVGETLGDVDSQAECSQTTGALPNFPG